MKTAAVSGPNATNQGRRMRSEMRPKRGCENDDVMEESATNVPTRVRLRWSLCTRSGRRGEKKLEYESIVRWPKAKRPRRGVMVRGMRGENSTEWRRGDDAGILIGYL